MFCCVFWGVHADFVIKKKCSSPSLIASRVITFSLSLSLFLSLYLSIYLSDSLSHTHSLSPSLLFWLMWVHSYITTNPFPHFLLSLSLYLSIYLSDSLSHTHYLSYSSFFGLREYIRILLLIPFHIVFLYYTFNSVYNSHSFQVVLRCHLNL